MRAGTTTAWEVEGTATVIVLVTRVCTAGLALATVLLSLLTGVSCLVEAAEWAGITEDCGSVVRVSSRVTRVRATATAGGATGPAGATERTAEAEGSLEVWPGLETGEWVAEDTARGLLETLMDTVLGKAVAEEGEEMGEVGSLSSTSVW